MLDKKHFVSCLNGLLTLKEIPIDSHKTDIFYSLMKNDFTDHEFADMCRDICQKETLFNKYPDPKLFYDRKVVETDSDRAFAASEAFCDKCQNYLLSNFVPDSTKRAFMERLTADEAAVLQRYGGISELWREMHRDDYPRSLGSILKDLRRDFEERYQITAKQDYLALAAPVNEENVKRLNDLVGKGIKRIGGIA